MSKTLTFGTVPSFEEFEAAYIETLTNKASGIPMPYYEIVLPNGTDYLNLQEAGLLRQYSSVIPVAQQSPRFDREEVINIGYGDRAAYYYTATQLYRLIENLADLHSIDSDEEFADWAGSFASSILSTLGFDWV